MSLKFFAKKRKICDWQKEQFSGFGILMNAKLFLQPYLQEAGKPLKHSSHTLYCCSLMYPSKSICLFAIVYPPWERTNASPEKKYLLLLSICLPAPITFWFSLNYDLINTSCSDGVMPASKTPASSVLSLQFWKPPFPPPGPGCGPPLNTGFRFLSWPPPDSAHKYCQTCCKSTPRLSQKDR